MITFVTVFSRASLAIQTLEANSDSRQQVAMMLGDVLICSMYHNVTSACQTGHKICRCSKLSSIMNLQYNSCILFTIFWIVASCPCGLFMLYMLLIIGPWANEQFYFMLPNGLIAKTRYYACLLQMRARSSEQNMIALFSWQMSQVAASFSFSRLTRSCFFTPFPGPCILQGIGTYYWTLAHDDPIDFVVSV